MCKQLLNILCLLPILLSAQVDYTGVYYLGGESKVLAGRPYGRIQVVHLPNQRAFVRMNYISGLQSSNSAAFSEVMQIENGRVVYTTQEDISCKVLLSFTDTGLVVTQSSTAFSFACGFGRNVAVDGIYRKSKEPAIAPIRVGEHRLSLQWIDAASAGTAILARYTKGSGFTIQGRQILTGYANKDSLSIKGMIYPLSDKELVFDGTIVSQTTMVNKGQPCVRKGVFTFKATQGRKYWRLQQMQNCEGGMVVDYIDLYF